MQRRTFIKISGMGLGCSLLPVGCSSSPHSSGAVSDSFEPDLHGVGPDHIVFDGDSGEYHIDPEHHRILTLGDDGIVREQFGGLGEEPGDFNYPVEAAFSEQGLLVLDRGNSRISVHDIAGPHSGTIGQHGDGRADLSHPTDLVVGPDGRVFVCDSGNNRIQVYDGSGRHQASIGGGSEEAHLNGPRGIAIDSNGSVHVSDTGNSRVAVFSRDGNFERSYGSFGEEPGDLMWPRSIVADGRGSIYVADPSSGFVSVFDEGGDFHGRFIPRESDGEAAAPLGLSLAPEGRIYVWTGGHGSVHSD